MLDLLRALKLTALNGYRWRDSFTSVAELELAIEPYVAHHDIDPKPFILTASATDMLVKVTRAKAALAAAAG